MKLHLTRIQHDRKHLSVLFVLQYKLKITPEERQLVVRYALASFVICESDLGTFRMRELVNGGEVSSCDFREIIQAEEGIVQGMRRFKALINEMCEFGGEEIIDF